MDSRVSLHIVKGFDNNCKSLVHNFKFSFLSNYYNILTRYSSDGRAAVCSTVGHPFESGWREKMLINERKFVIIDLI